jgi:uncharacterized protein (TIGR03086 family)
MDEMQVLTTAYDRTAALTGTLTADDLRRPTPCSDWDVRALLGHVVAGTDGLVAMLRAEAPDFGKDDLGDDPAARVRRSRDEALAAWSEPGAVDTPSQQMPGMRVVDFAMADAVVHCWDLAAALGQPCGLDDEVVRPVWERWSGDAADTGRQYSAFGPAVEVPAAAPLLDRLVGLLGRDPAAAAPDNSHDGSAPRG